MARLPRCAVSLVISGVLAAAAGWRAGMAALPDGDSTFGCRQMLGNVWEWTADTFNPYPGFEADVYREYSDMLFGSTRVLRGGAWTTRSRMIHGTFRNFFEPHRWDVFSGFRVCKL